MSFSLVFQVWREWEDFSFVCTWNEEVNNISFYSYLMLLTMMLIFWQQGSFSRFSIKKQMWCLGSLIYVTAHILTFHWDNKPDDLFFFFFP